MQRIMHWCMVVSLVAVFVAMHAHQRQAAEPEANEDAVSSVVDAVCTPDRLDDSLGKFATPEPGESPTASTTTRPGNSPNVTTKPQPGKPAEPGKSPDASGRTTPVSEEEYPRFTFRFSSRGGCFADSDYFFEAQSGPEGARWKAVVDGYLDWHEMIDRGPNQGKKRPAGNFVSQGTLTPEQAKSLVDGLVASGAFDVRATDCCPSTTFALYLDFQGRTNRVAVFQPRVMRQEATSGAPPDPNATFLDYCYNSFVTQAGEDAQKRFDQGLPPDSQPPHPPGPSWPLNSASLFNNG